MRPNRTRKKGKKERREKVWEVWAQTQGNGEEGLFWLKKRWGMEKKAVGTKTQIKKIGAEGNCRDYEKLIESGQQGRVRNRGEKRNPGEWEVNW